MTKLLSDRARIIPVLVVAVVIAVGATLVVVLTSASSGGGGSAPTKSAAATGGKGKTVTVDISMFAFRPSTVTVTPGTTVAWTNQDSTAHTATANNGTTFDTGSIQHGQTKTFTFTKPGTYAYRCAIHPFMNGTVIVK
jgi:plastocyanin